MNASSTLSPAPITENIAAVIVTYYPDTGLPDRVRRISDQGVFVTIVDNTPGLAAEAVFRELHLTNMEVWRNGKNVGLASALNQGVRRAFDLGYSWALLLDQDTLVDSTLIQGLIDAYKTYPRSHMTGLIAGNARSKVSGRLAQAFCCGGQAAIEVKTVTTSGSLLSLSVFNRIGPFREDFFIEGIDLEYCLRIRKHGLNILCTREPLMTHVGGRGIEQQLLTRKVLIADHDPWRYYLMVRNFVCILKSYVRHEPLWVAATVVSYGKLIVKVVLFERNKIRKIYAMMRGLAHGLGGKIENNEQDYFSRSNSGTH
jgi:rhamnosyltransferase